MVIGAEVFDGAEEGSASEEEAVFGLAEACEVPREVGPVGSLPVPGHEG